jgi:hypothetical protein
MEMKNKEGTKFKAVVYLSDVAAEAGVVISFVRASVAIFVPTQTLPHVSVVRRSVASGVGTLVEVEVAVEVEVKLVVLGQLATLECLLFLGRGGRMMPQ